MIYGPGYVTVTSAEKPPESLPRNSGAAIPDVLGNPGQYVYRPCLPAVRTYFLNLLGGAKWALPMPRPYAPEIRLTACCPGPEMPISRHGDDPRRSVVTPWHRIVRRPDGDVSILGLLDPGMDGYQARPTTTGG